MKLLEKNKKLDKRSRYLRKKILEALLSSNRGHFGPSMSLVEIFRVLYDDIIKFDSKNPNTKNRDRVILSKGHGCLALYSILEDKNFFKNGSLKNFLQFKSLLGGHPEHFVPGVEVSTGALGHGLPIAIGIAKALLMKKKKNKVFVILGDGELNEGSNWEALFIAEKYQLSNLKIIIDYNKLQSYGRIDNIANLEPLRKKFESFNLNVSEIDGHNLIQLRKNFRNFYNNKFKSTSVTICHTIKGKGFVFAENNPLWHHKNNFTKEERKQIFKSLV